MSSGFVTFVGMATEAATRMFLRSTTLRAFNF